MPPKQQFNSTPPIVIRDVFSKGIIMEDVVDEFYMPSGAANWAINGHGDRIGAFTVRSGLTIVP